MRASRSARVRRALKPHEKPRLHLRPGAFNLLAADISVAVMRRSSSTVKTRKLGESASPEVPA